MHPLLVLTAVMALATAAHVDNVTCRGGAGVCVPYYQCVNGSVVTNIFEVRIGETHECSNLIEVCCSNPNPTIKSPTEPPAQYTSTCGRRNTQGNDIKITDLETDETQVGEFPWMAALFMSGLSSGSKDYDFVCGGSLIHPSIVLTAATCVRPSFSNASFNLRVRLGEWDFENEYEPHKHQDIDVQSVIVHPHYDGDVVKGNDYALLYLKTPAVLSRNVDVICLESVLSYSVKKDQRCVLTGWGEQGVRTRNVLKQVNLPIVDNYQCQAALRREVHGSFLCAGGEDGKDACTGDGGSPLVCLDSTKNRYVQIGISSWGLTRCGTAGFPGVYSNVLYGYPWILKEAGRLLEGWVATCV